MTEQQKTSVTVYREDLKWLKREKIDRNCKTLAETFHKIKEENQNEE